VDSSWRRPAIFFDLTRKPGGGESPVGKWGAVGGGKKVRSNAMTTFKRDSVNLGTYLLGQCPGRERKKGQSLGEEPMGGRSAAGSEWSSEDVRERRNAILGGR